MCDDLGVISVLLYIPQQHVTIRASLHDQPYGSGCGSHQHGCNGLRFCVVCSVDIHIPSPEKRLGGSRYPEDGLEGTRSLARSAPHALPPLFSTQGNIAKAKHGNKVKIGDGFRTRPALLVRVFGIPPNFEIKPHIPSADKLSSIFRVTSERGCYLRRDSALH